MTIMRALAAVLLVISSCGAFTMSTTGKSSSVQQATTRRSFSSSVASVAAAALGAAVLLPEHAQASVGTQVSIFVMQLQSNSHYAISPTVISHLHTLNLAACASCCSEVLHGLRDLTVSACALSFCATIPALKNAFVAPTACV
jgi:hypothetical protein